VITDFCFTKFAINDRFHESEKGQLMKRKRPIDGLSQKITTYDWLIVSKPPAGIWQSTNKVERF